MSSTAGLDGRNMMRSSVRMMSPSALYQLGSQRIKDTIP